MTSTITTPAATTVPSVPLQPLLHDEVAVIAAPTQAWSGRDGAIGANPVHGYWTGDQRFVSAVRVSVEHTEVEPIAV
ncbi:amylo-alpha-1,6-glucosidase, partial [Bacillus sp. S34]|nr:amylo-alpha-1,6-glucosidase [Bacillus sp. S34]